MLIPEQSPVSARSRVPQRIVVTGTTGVGKSTLARQLAALIDAPHIELDALHWEPEWTEATTEVFRARVAEATASGRWVVDGNYRKARDLTWDRAELFIWLDYSIARIYWQLLRRTTRRVVTQEELWAGNRERFRAAFMSKESLFVWALQTHWKKRREYPSQLLEHPQLRILRLRSPRQTRAFVRSLERIAGDPQMTRMIPDSDGGAIGDPAPTQHLTSNFGAARRDSSLRSE